jgi:hypothetical protein
VLFFTQTVSGFNNITSQVRISHWRRHLTCPSESIVNLKHAFERIVEALSSRSASPLPPHRRKAVIILGPLDRWSRVGFVRTHALSDRRLVGGLPFFVPEKNASTMNRTLLSHIWEHFAGFIMWSRSSKHYGYMQSVGLSFRCYDRRQELGFIRWTV